MEPQLRRNINPSELWLDAHDILNSNDIPMSFTIQQVKRYRNIGVMAENDGWKDRSRTDRLCEFLVWLHLIDDWEDERDDLLWRRFRASNVYKSMSEYTPLNLVSIEPR
ncbi:hypothetical protein N7456_012216 [Penicillium angulare]|uniref:Uncharacterized protein n=1 Tax=Penicillium angulare TaxID=116970 RepID=A0A9W9EVE6_9EURO|nr:hypothetical protein N7456_012216 [Penicillium angulare]